MRGVVCLLGVFVPFFWNSYRQFAGQVDGSAGLSVAVWLLVSFVVLEIVLHAAIALQAPKDAATPRSAWVIQQVVLLAIVVAELVKFGGQVLLYRRNA